MKRFFVWSYPKLTLYVLFTILSYYLFHNIISLDGLFLSTNIFYISIFLAGLFYSTGFTTPFATGFFLSLDVANPVIIASIAGFGALLADFGIFSFIRFSFMNEFHLLEHSSIIRHINHGLSKILNKGGKKVLTILLAIFFISSPLPDEIGVALLAGFTKLHPRIFAVISFLSNSSGILLLLLL